MNMGGQARPHLAEKQSEPRGCALYFLQSKASSNNETRLLRVQSHQRASPHCMALY
jgi:hypothetical protein